jgi:prepilin-type N-terminal cleavage/methylation domain-containing protein
MVRAWTAKPDVAMRELEKRLAGRSDGVAFRQRTKRKRGIATAPRFRFLSKTPANHPDMKIRSHSRAPRGFTLVELLVVISIIVVLAALSFGAAQVAIKKGNTLKAKTDATALVSAIEQYYQEYSKMPSVGSGTEEILTQGEVGIKLLEILLGKEDDTGTMQNPRKIPFLSVGVSKSKKKGGLVYSRNGGQIIGLYDPWGIPFRIKFDDDYDDEILDPTTPGGIIRNEKVVVYSLGADMKLGKTTKGTNDDVKTW